ncbi:hypothetical protein [Flavobacterium kingsejongi]|uniref:Lipoprotein n=1 Tax=Flavobacterium kingsejongi TaxID=1678728 RepID=A0A2S1LTC9_9FLAO|nr:hypothetical protein [Flavobacterium kingsejongi]AWG26974.1 hypothetical protein FK004_17910 [Flavobacterium kingsejongi]
MKLKNIKRIYLFSILFMVSSCAAQSIIYEPVGIMDKPLPTIEIYTKEKKKERNNVKVFIVNDKTFALLKKHISNNVIKSKVGEEYQYGSYKVSCTNGSEKIEYIIESKEASHIFFQQQLSIVKQDKQLYEQLNTLLMRLR